MSTSTIDLIKRAAQRLRRTQGLAHGVSLDVAARNHGYENFAHAKLSLGVR
jgi:hypothetical protein